jgi:hypothetical protein
MLSLSSYRTMSNDESRDLKESPRLSLYNKTTQIKNSLIHIHKSLIDPFTTVNHMASKNRLDFNIYISQLRIN